MRKFRIVFLLVAIFSIQSVFADEHDTSSNSSKPCATIAKACSKAGFARTQTPNKAFWDDCMKPIILGQTVHGVTIDAATAKACRMNKIEELKKELDEFQKV